jgi:VWFA-related protein
MKRFFAVVAVLLTSFAAAAQEQPYEERIDVSAVLLDVTVTDSRGNQILGLDIDDFVVTEDGVRQQIDSVDYFTNRRLLTSPESKAAFKVERVREERYFILFFDKLLDASNSTYRSDLLNVRDAAIRFVSENIFPEDKVAVAGFDARLKIYADFTSDREVLVAAIRDAIKTGARGLTEPPATADGSPSILAGIDRSRLMGSGRIYDALRLLADAVQPITGRKAMMLFSSGIGDAVSMSSPLPASEDRRYQPMIAALNRANVSVYSIRMIRGAEFHAGEHVLSRIADETGGEYFRQIIDFGTPLRAAEKENSGYYLLTYRSSKRHGESGYQKVDVKLRNPEFRVKAREGYAY